MKRKIAYGTVALIMFFSEYAISQSIYYDALDLSKSLAGSPSKFEGEPFIKILLRYAPSGSSFTAGTLKEYYKNNNPFIKPFILSGTGSENRSLTGIPKIITEGANGLTVTNLADGLAKFIVERTKTELNIAFFNRFKDELNKQKKLRVLFPQTHSVLNAIETEIYNYSIYLETLKTVFRKDLRILYPSLCNLLQEPEYKNQFKDNIPAKTILEILPVGSMLIDGRHPSEIISYLATEFKVEGANRLVSNLENSFDLLNLISQSFISKEPKDGRWISKEEFARLFNASVYPHAFQLYVGLLYQQSNGIAFQDSDGTTQTFRNFLTQADTIADNLIRLEPGLRNVYYQASIVDQSLKTILGISPEKLSYDNFYQFTQAALNLMKSGNGLRKQILDQKPERNDEAEDSFFHLLGLLNDINLDLRMKNYSSALMNTVAILDAVVKNEEFKKYRTNLIKYGSFMATVAEAENSDGVKKAIEAVALPPGSASQKKRTKFNVAMNTYLGGFYAKEDLRLEDNKAKVIGMTSPLGISISIPAHFWLSSKDFGSISFFASIIDIGAITAYRIKDDSTQSLPEIKLKNIVAPGMYLIYGIPGVPLSIGTGWQVGAELRKVARTMEGAELDVKLTPSSGSRFMIFAAVDIPLFSFYTKPR